MKIGSIVEAKSSFDDVRATWGFDYPVKGQLLTVRAIEPHPSPECGALLYFDEKPHLIGLSLKQINGKYNFVEVVPPLPIHEMIKQTVAQ
jgi:hypothetical protein